MPYLTQADYISRFGDAELINLTDADATGQPDAFTFDKAVAEVSAEMDGYLAARYALPLADPAPALVTSLASALVREKLHTAFPTETVTREADRARRMLGDLATGKARLLIPTGEAAAPQTSVPTGIAVVVGQPRVFTSDILAKF